VPDSRVVEILPITVGKDTPSCVVEQFCTIWATRKRPGQLLVAVTSSMILEVAQIFAVAIKFVVFLCKKGFDTIDTVFEILRFTIELKTTIAA